MIPVHMGHILSNRELVRECYDLIMRSRLLFLQIILLIFNQGEPVFLKADIQYAVLIRFNNGRTLPVFFMPHRI